MAPCLLRWGQQTFTAASPGHWEDHESGQVTPAPKLVPESPSADRGMGPPALRPHPHSGYSSLFSGRWQVQILVLSTLQAPGSRMGTWANERKCCSSPISLMPLGLQLTLQSASTYPAALEPQPHPQAFWFWWDSVLCPPQPAGPQAEAMPLLLLCAWRTADAEKPLYQCGSIEEPRFHCCSLKGG